MAYSKYSHTCSSGEHVMLYLLWYSCNNSLDPANRKQFSNMMERTAFFEDEEAPASDRQFDKILLVNESSH